MGPQGNIFEGDTGPGTFRPCLCKGRSTSGKAVRMQFLSSNRGKFVENRGPIPVFFASVFRPDGLPLSWRDGIPQGAWFSTALHQRVSMETVFLSSKVFHDFSTIFPRFVSRNMKNHHISRRMKNGDFELKSGAPGGTRTHDPLLRRQMLYPAELPEHIKPCAEELLFHPPQKSSCGMHASPSVAERQAV